MKLVTKGLIAGLVLILVACGNNAEKAAEAPPAVPPTPEAYTWAAIAPSTVEAGPPAAAALSGGYAYAVMPDTAVAGGDSVTARMTLQGPANRWVRVLLQRHCDSANGDDGEERDVALNGGAQPIEINHTFQQTYSCIRLSLVSMDGQALALTVSDLVVTKTSDTLRE
jgi:hypothetical protein